MNVRPANIADVRAIHALINAYAERDQMLFRSLADIYKSLQTFIVAELNNEVIGCCALEVIWSDLAEIKSLAVSQAHKGIGVGTALVTAALDQAKRLGLPRVLGLTLKPQFFQRQGFTVVEKDSLPMKVWSDCARCTKQQNCDETAVVKVIEGASCPLPQ